MKYARIEQGKVIELVEIEGDPAEQFHESLTFVAAPQGCAVGWLMQGGVPVAPPIDVEPLRAAKRAAIDRAYHAAIERGLPFGDGDAIQIDAESRQNLAARATRAGFVIQNTAGFTWPPGGMAYRTRNNLWPVFTPAEMVALSQQVDDLFTAIRIRYAALKGDCKNAGSAEVIAGINETTGWPA
ncbi:MAG: hypothetical protein K2Y40_02560 [Reyranella sp.]|nr:hypothetical protein [Reyranella sp.]